MTRFALTPTGRAKIIGAHIKSGASPIIPWSHWESPDWEAFADRMAQSWKRAFGLDITRADFQIIP